MKEYSILIVDDMPSNLQIIFGYLKKTGLPYKILQAPSGSIACKIIEKVIPDLVITDWEMPQMDGLELVKYFKNHQLTKDVPVIMCTGVMTTSQNLQTALEAGAVDFIRKPVDEIELIARVNSMLKLSDSIKKIKNQNESLLIQSIEINRQKEEIKAQAEDLIKTNATKDKFFSIIAHDLRGPVGNLVSFLELLTDERNNYTADKQLQFLSLLKNAAQTTYTLLNNLLTWAQTQRNEIVFKPTKNSLLAVINANIGLFANSLHNKKIKLVNSLSQDYVFYFDNNMINTVIRNLLNNAIKYTDENGKITIAVSENYTHIVFSIKDTGKGMSSETKVKLFKLDVKQHSTPGTKGESGTGLGLIICKEFIEKHSGDIWVESELGMGSTFTFTLPTKMRELKN